MNQQQAATRVAACFIWKQVKGKERQDRQSQGGEPGKSIRLS